MSLWEVSLTALAVALVCTPLCMWLARALHVVDRPGPLKAQSVPVPYLGGVAVLVAVLAAMWSRISLLEPLALATAIGVADDVVDLPPGIRLVGQGLVGLVTAAVVHSHLPATAAVVVAVVAAVVLMNGVNMVDGLDALATAVVASAAAAFAIVHGGASRQLGLAIVFASLGFLFYNRPPARVYLGDGGSYLLGAALAELLMLSWARGVRSAVGVGALLLVALPVAELGATVLRRLRAGSNLVTGDRGHSYDRMVAGGASVPLVVLVFVGVQVLLGSLAVAIDASGSLVVAVPVVAVAVAGLALTAALSGLLVPEGGSRQ